MDLTSIPVIGMFFQAIVTLWEFSWITISGENIAIMFLFGFPIFTSLLWILCMLVALPFIVIGAILDKKQ